MLSTGPDLVPVIQDDIRILAQVVSYPDLSSPTLLDPVLRTDGWQTLMAVAAESRPSRPSKAAPPPSASDFPDIPPEAFDDVPDSADDGGGGKVCPHCTFVNPPGSVDCEVCGLPLEG